MSNQELALVMDERASQEQVAQEKTRGRSKKRETSSDVMAVLDEKLRKMRTATLEFNVELDEVKGQINEVKRTLHHEFTNVVNQTMADLRTKMIVITDQEVDRSPQHKMPIHMLFSEVANLPTNIEVAKLNEEPNSQ